MPYMEKGFIISMLFCLFFSSILANSIYFFEKCYNNMMWASGFSIVLIPIYFFSIWCRTFEP